MGGDEDEEEEGSSKTSSELGVLVSEVPDSLLSSIKAGMQVVEVNTVDVSSGMSFTDVMKMLTDGVRPLTLGFRSTLEHQVLESMTEDFLEADQDGSGALDREEIAAVIQKMYRKEGVSRKSSTILQEVDRIMNSYDVDGSGVLEFGEFVAMTMSPEAMRSLSPHP